VQVYGSKDDKYYQDITYNDRASMTHRLDGTVSYQFKPKTAIFTEGDLGYEDFYNSSLVPNSWFTSGWMGLRGSLTNKISGSAKGGFKFQAYDSSSIFNDKPFFGFVADVGLAYSTTKDDTFNLALTKDIQESTYNNMNYFDRYDLNLRYTHKFSEKFLVRPYGSYRLNLYPGASTEGGVTGQRYDNIFGGGLTLRYDVNKWYSLEIRYDYSQRISKFSTFDYVDNRVIFSGTGGF